MLNGSKIAYMQPQTYAAPQSSSNWGFRLVGIFSKGNYDRNWFAERRFMRLPFPLFLRHLFVLLLLYNMIQSFLVLLPCLRLKPDWRREVQKSEPFQGEVQGGSSGAQSPVRSACYVFVAVLVPFHGKENKTWQVWFSPGIWNAEAWTPHAETWLPIV